MGELADYYRHHPSGYFRRFVRNTSQADICLSYNCCGIPGCEWIHPVCRGTHAATSGRENDVYHCERAGGQFSESFISFMERGTHCWFRTIPGSDSWNSRTGVTIVAGLGVRLNHEDAARYSFLLGTPLIGLAALLEIPQLVGQTAQTWLYVVFGAIIAGIVAYLATKFLMKYFETGRLYPFAYYCWGAGLVSLFLLFTIAHGRV